MTWLARLAAAAAVVATAAAGCAATARGGPDGGCGSSGPALRAGAAGTPVCAPVTWYGAPDNDPPGSRIIAHPGPAPRHPRAGGTGTYADPVTFATEYPDDYPVGSRIYVPVLRKYFVREDDCACRHGPHHVDLWMGGAPGDRRVLACETDPRINGRQLIVLDPASDLPVDTTPVYRDGHCRP